MNRNVGNARAVLRHGQSFRCHGVGAFARDNLASARSLTAGALATLLAVVGVLLFSAASALAAPPETPETRKASAITGTTATLNGVLNAKAKVAEPLEYDFLYQQSALECAEGIAVPEAPVKTPGKPKEAVSANVTGLEPSKPYTFCVLAKHNAESSSGLPVTFKTLGVAPKVDSESTSAVNSTGATFEAQVNPNNQETTFKFEYSTKATGETLEGTITTVEGAAPMPAGFGDQLASVSTGAVLEPGTTYFYRVVAEDGTPPATKGSVQSFTTVPTPHTDPVEAITATTATLSGHLSLNSADTKYSFDYKLGTECTGGTTTPTADAGTGATTASESVPVTGLQPHHEYAVCLVISNAFGSEQGSPATFTTSSEAPLIEEASVLEVSGDSATFQGVLNPTGAETTYKFEYGPSSSYGATAPVPDGKAGAGSTAMTVESHVQGLTSNTLYHYRLAATNALGTTVGPDQTFATQSANGFALPDNRAWEMVSPPDKQGAQIYAIGQYSNEGSVIQASAAGSAMTYVAAGVTEAQPPGYTNLVQVLSTRSPTGWGSRDIAIPHDTATGPAIGIGEEYRFFSEDLSLGVVQPFGAFMPSLSEEASEQTAYLRTDYLNHDLNNPCVSSCYRPLVRGIPGHGNVPPGTAFGEEGKCPGTGGGSAKVICGPEFLGATPDLSHTVLASGVALTSQSIGGLGLYEWSGGQLALISVLPEEGGPASAPVLGFGNKDARHAISDDGSRIVWSEAASEEHLYMRDTANAETVQLDAIHGGSGEGPALSHFQVASSDGSKVFFTDEQRLTGDSGALEGKPDLYECEMVATAGKLECKLSDLTPSSSGESADVQGSVLGASKDGLWLYFAANGALTSNASPGQCVGEGVEVLPSATCNLYVRHGGVTSFVAVLSGEDRADWAVSLEGLTARVSSNGRFLAFMSQRELAGYNTHDAVSGKGDEEVYLYDAQAERLVCASCNPTGARPVGVQYGSLHGLASGFGVWEPTTWLAANIPGWTPYLGGSSRYQSRYLSGTGRLFFNSHDALVPQDVNGTEDVYQYEPQGVGDCTSASGTFSGRSGGCLGLISSGSGAEESGFLDASENGGDVFFLTTGKLAPQDHDDAVDIYDAHECTSAAPCLPTSAAQPPPCTTEASCRPAPTPQPSIFGPPSSATFSGAGNLVPPAALKPAMESLTRAQRLAKALKACRTIRNKRKRAGCESKARTKYGTKAKSKSRKGAK